MIWLLFWLLSLIFFSPALTTFFIADDFYILKLAQVDNFRAVIAWFGFYQPAKEFLFYRPLTAQFFWFSFYHLFGFRPIYYHLFMFLLFGLSLYLVYQLALKLADKNIAMITTFLYAFSASNLTRLAWITQVQELGLGVTFLASCWFFIKDKRWLSWLLFLLALMTKETAIILPLVLWLLAWFKNKKINYLSFIVKYGLSLGLYLYLRLMVMGTSTAGTYFTHFSFKKILNTGFWYSLWSLGLPELLVDHIGSGFKLKPELFNYYGNYIVPIFATFILLVFSLALALVRKHKALKSKLNWRLVWFSLIFFGLTLGPHLFSAFHKFTYELTLPLFGLSLLLASLVKWKMGQWQRRLTLTLFLSLSLLTNLLTLKTHWVFSRSQAAKKVFNYMQTNYINLNQPVYFYNDQPAPNPIWGVSRQIDQTLFGSSAFQVLYSNPALEVFYEDDNLPPNNLEVIELPSSPFLN